MLAGHREGEVLSPVPRLLELIRSVLTDSGAATDSLADGIEATDLTIGAGGTSKPMLQFR